MRGRRSTGSHRGQRGAGDARHLPLAAALRKGHRCVPTACGRVGAAQAGDDIRPSSRSGRSARRRPATRPAHEGRGPQDGSGRRHDERTRCSGWERRSTTCARRSVVGPGLRPSTPPYIGGSRGGREPHIGRLKVGIRTHGCGTDLTDPQGRDNPGPRCRSQPRRGHERGAGVREENLNGAKRSSATAWTLITPSIGNWASEGAKGATAATRAAYRDDDGVLHGLSVCTHLGCCGVKTRSDRGRRTRLAFDVDGSPVGTAVTDLDTKTGLNLGRACRDGGGRRWPLSTRLSTTSSRLPP